MIQKFDKNQFQIRSIRFDSTSILSKCKNNSSFSGRKKIVRLLVELGANTNQKTNLEFKPLHSAVKFNQIEIAQMLINFGADAECRNTHKETPLNMAARLGLTSMCKSLIGNGANKDAQDVLNRTPLHNANDYYHVEVLLTLLKCGASQHIKNVEGDKFLESSLKTKNHNIFKTIFYHQ